MKIIIANDEIIRFIDSEAVTFPKYATQILNLANQNAQGTRPKTVGKMSDLIQQFKGQKLEEWEKWYLNKHPEAIEKATQKISQMIGNFKKAIFQIDDEMITNWVRDLVIVKSFVGLKFQEAILKKVATIYNEDYRLANPAEESRGIDGFIGDRVISIKPLSYKSKEMLPEKINYLIIYYEKTKKGLNIFLEK